MFMKKYVFALPFAVLLSLSLITTASTVGTQVDAEAGEASQNLTVYIQSLHTDNKGLSITTDEIEWYEGESAAIIFAEREPEAAAELGGPPDDYYIVNDSDLLTTYPVADDATVTMQMFDHTGQMEDLDIQWNESLPLQQFSEEFGKTDIIDLSGFPYHITIKNGVITSIVQQYIP
ncbi:hypothetical protein [Paenibacillus sp. sgz500958]|uniref:hypothetical protein n=1 Tax=Paenibacillus sp. sgz500958 TaxID=3242475 RepID=UPI0036D306F6